MNKDLRAMNKDLKILIVDDEEACRETLSMILQAEGYQVKQCIKSKEVTDILKTEYFDIIISDLIMPEMDGIALLKAVKKIRPNLFFIILTAHGTINNAVEAMKQGAYTYVIKGSDPEELLKEIQNIEKLKQTQSKETESTAEPNGSSYMMNTKSKLYREVLDMASKVAKSEANVLILGESGAGKEVIAQYIHSESNRSKNSFYATNCHVFSNSLLESELFGHEKGSFTGALSTRIGRFEAAQSGTLFLDEIGDIPLTTQAKLLRAIETKMINRIGSNDEIKVDFRLISATNKDLSKEIKEGNFREDIFYRLSTIIIQVPPLRDRKEDLPDLIQFFAEKVKSSMGIERIEIDNDVMDFLLNYRYPGNIRELKNIIERMVVLSDDGHITSGSIPNLMYDDPDAMAELSEANYTLKDVRREFESKYIENVLKRNQYNVTKSAKDLDISTRHLFNKISEYGIRDCQDKGVSKGEFPFSG
ncbi:MAG: sigma-54 dependent transcriptional regulator [Eubacteriales bacterium]|nr:sigma-54 dependent transcriptional regulator [Eubacteriales bacterium]MDD3199034.1 sigma-54 dependent transcriptional regulator [Eubacteriales bacterium]MDD4629480.1 sigma-54 dependent transcriptional regulator [Eubacteriales bacterium]